MSKKLKYVIIQGIFPILFGEGTIHSDLDKAGNVTSAGFCAFKEQKDGRFKVQCWGKSVSLGIKSTPENDEQIISLMLSEY